MTEAEMIEFLERAKSDGSDLPTEYNVNVSARYDTPEDKPEERPCHFCKEPARTGYLVITAAGDRWLSLCPVHYPEVSKADEALKAAGDALPIDDHQRRRREVTETELIEFLERIKADGSSLPQVVGLGLDEDPGRLLKLRAQFKLYDCAVCGGTADTAAIVATRTGKRWLDLCVPDLDAVAKANQQAADNLLLKPQESAPNNEVPPVDAVPEPAEGLTLAALRERIVELMELEDVAGDKPVVMSGTLAPVTGLRWAYAPDKEGVARFMVFIETA